MANAQLQRLEKLQSIEQDITAMLNLVSDAVEELAKDAPSAPIVEYKTKDLIKTLEGIEKGLSEEILYLTKVSTAQAHEGSVYGAEKDHELCRQQVMLAKERLQQFTV
ncbi:hypothetical protein EMCRGX_G028615 [Ephydatia muelleri]|eukprot:Em0020g42a